MTGPSDSELARVIGAAAGAEVAVVSRHPYQYATSAALEEVVVRIGGDERVMILKDLARRRLLDDARRSKPAWLYEPRREIDTYTQILAGVGIGPRCYGAGAEQSWLVMEKVAGVELWQVGELDVWEAVAGWLARFHHRFAHQLDDVRAANPFLIELDQHWFEDWASRAAKALAESNDGRARDLRDRLGAYDAVAAPLAELPRTFVHGEFYPSNVLVTGDGDVRPVDWEMSAIGSGLVDLAALTAGWAAPEQECLVSAYAASSTEPVDPAGLDRCRLHLALQWLGWASNWDVPHEHAHDWIGEALAVADNLGLG